jgi:hypothetical protein
MLGNLLVSHGHEARAERVSSRGVRAERVERVDKYPDIRRDTEGRKERKKKKLTTRGPAIYAQNDPNAR